MIDVSIIIVNFNTTELTLNCINSIIEYTKSIIYEIIVIDNSPYKDIRLKRNDLKNYMYIYAGDNLGFGRANNLGVSYASGKYIFLLNSDTILLNDAIGMMYNYLNNYSNKSVGIIGAYLMNEKAEIESFATEFPSIKNLLIQFFNIAIKRIYKIRRKRIDVNIDREVEVICGADLFMLRSLFNKVGGFDNDYFLYGEEVELERRIANLGYKRIIISGPQIIHLEGQSDNRINKLSTSTIYRISVGKLLYSQKHFSKIYGWFYIFINFILSIGFSLLDLRYNKEERKKLLSLYVSFLFSKNKIVISFHY